MSGIWVNHRVIIQYNVRGKFLNDQFQYRIRCTTPAHAIIQDRFADFLFACHGAILVVIEENERKGIVDSWYEMWFMNAEDAVQFRLMQP